MEETSIAVLAEDLAAANGVAEIVRVIHGDALDIELPERVDVVVSEWLGGFGIDEGMLVPVITARDRWLKPGGVMIPHSVTAWAALVHDRYLQDMVHFLKDNPYGLRLDELVHKTVNEILYRELPSPGRRRQALRAQLLFVDDPGGRDLCWNRLEAPHQAETVPARAQTTVRLTLWRSGSAPSSRPASPSPSALAIHPPTGG